MVACSPGSRARGAAREAAGEGQRMPLALALPPRAEAAALPLVGALKDKGSSVALGPAVPEGETAAALPWAAGPPDEQCPRELSQQLLPDRPGEQQSQRVCVGRREQLRRTVSAPEPLAHGSAMLDAVDLAQHGWVSLLWGSGCLLRLCPRFLLLLAAWATMRIWCSVCGKRRQVSPWSWCGGRHSDARDPGDEQRASGCRARGGFLCYDLSCRPCGEAARERQRQLEAEAWQSPWASSRPQSPSSEDSSPWRAHSERRRLPARHRGLPQRGPGAPRPLPPATDPTDLELCSQADKLAGLTHALPERAVSPQADSPTTLGSRLAEGAGSLPGGTDPRPVWRLELEHKFKKMLRMHLIKKCTEIRLAGFPTMVQASWEVSICSLGHPAAPPLLRSTTAPKYFHTAEALFLPEEARETLELHIRAKRLQHQQSLSKESPAAHVPKAPVSAHQEQRQESPVQLPAQHPPCLPQATEHRAELQPEPLRPERDNSGQEEKKQQGSDTQGRMWRLRNTKGAVTYTAQRLSQSPRATRWTILRVLVLHPPSKGSFS
ncbi:uncharacterized protein LOC135329763 [Dromaius novaehollandiae]|uniref:uncharacterized protein LOC135329763 n=1 Tax=Dromaius novaehollandiae TaxID=8790 RepID=UPI00311E077F